jgi:Ras family
MLIALPDLLSGFLPIASVDSKKSEHRCFPIASFSTAFVSQTALYFVFTQAVSRLAWLPKKLQKLRAFPKNSLSLVSANSPFSSHSPVLIALL